MTFIWRKYPVDDIQYLRSESGAVVGVRYRRTGESTTREIRTRQTLTRFMRDHARALWKNQR